MMKKLLCVVALMAAVIGTAMAEDGAENKTALLKEGKSWVYDYHHFDDQDKSQKPVETVYAVEFVLQGDTVINGLDYFKLFLMELIMIVEKIIKEAKTLLLMVVR